VFAVFNGRKDKSARRLVTAHQFDHNGDFRIIENFTGIGRKQILRNFDAARGSDINIGDFL